MNRNFVYFYLFLSLILWGCEKKFLRSSFFPYFNKEKKGIYINEEEIEGFIQKLKDTSTTLGNLEVFHFLDERKYIKEEKDYLYELLKLEYFVPEKIELKIFLAPFLPLFPLDGEEVDFRVNGNYIIGTDTIYFEFKRKIKVYKNESYYDVYITDIEIERLNNTLEKKKSEFFYRLEIFDLPRIITKGGQKWIKEN